MVFQPKALQFIRNQLGDDEFETCGLDLNRVGPCVLDLCKKGLSRDVPNREVLDGLPEFLDVRFPESLGLIIVRMLMRMLVVVLVAIGQLRHPHSLH